MNKFTPIRATCVCLKKREDCMWRENRERQQVNKQLKCFFNHSGVIIVKWTRGNY